jgi:hypothetical protein
VRETFLLDQMKIVEVIQPKIGILVQTERIQKQDGNAKNKNKAQADVRARPNAAYVCNRTRCFQCFSFEVLGGSDWIRSSYGIIARMQAPTREALFPEFGGQTGQFPTSSPSSSTGTFLSLIMRKPWNPIPE